MGNDKTLYMPITKYFSALKARMKSFHLKHKLEDMMLEEISKTQKVKYKQPHHV